MVNLSKQYYFLFIGLSMIVIGCGKMDDPTTFSFFVTENNPVDGTGDLLSFTGIPAFPGHYPIMPFAIFPIADLSVSLAVKIYNGETRESYIVSDSLESFIDVEQVNFETNEWKVNFHLEMTLNAPPWVNPVNDIYPRDFTISDGMAKGKFPE
jgi:hypothetical protein